MQLVRTLFIVDYNKTVRRKIAEIFLAIWIEKKFTKQQIIDMYVASVMFTPRKYGVISTIKYLYGRKKLLSNEEAFVIVERLSNRNNQISQDRIINKVLKLQNAKIQINEEEIKRLYNSLLIQEKLFGTPF